MKTILALAAVLLFSWPAAAQNNCNIELKPLKPLTPIGCTDTTPACLCNPSGTNCHWTWACVSSGRQSGIDPTIPLQVSPVQVPDLMETYRKALEIRNLQLQEQQRREESQPLGIVELPRPAVVPELSGTTRQAQAKSSAASMLTHGTSMLTYGDFNGLAWLTMDALPKTMYIRGMFEGMGVIDSESKTNATSKFFPDRTFSEIAADLDHFYQEPENVLICVTEALNIATLKFNGVPQAKIDTLVSLKRQIALLSPEHHSANQPVK